MKKKDTKKLISKTASIIFLFSCFSATFFAQVGLLKVVVGGRELTGSAQAEIRGNRILLPVVPIARQLGHTALVDNSAQSIKIIRVGIQAEFIKQSGEIRENGVTTLALPLISADAVFSADENAVLIPSEIAAALLNVSIFTDEKKGIVRVESKDVVNSTATTEKKGGLEFGGVNYTYNYISQNGNFYQNLNLISSGRIGNNTFYSNLNLFGGLNYRFLDFQGGNFTLKRPNADEIQIGDLTTTTASDLTLVNTLVRGASFTRYLNDRSRISVYGGRIYSGIIENFARRDSVGIPFDSTLFGTRFSFQPYSVKPNQVQRRTLSFSFGSVYYRGKNNSGLIFNGISRYTTQKFNLSLELAAAQTDIERPRAEPIKGLGTGLIFNGSYRPWKFLTLQGGYSRFSPKFSEPSALSQYNNRESKFVSISVQPVKNMVVGVNASVNQNNRLYLFQNLSLNSYKTQNLGFNFGYDPQMKFLPRVSLTATKSESPLFGNFTIVNANLTKEYKFLRPYLNYYLTDQNGRASHGFSLGSTVDAGKFGQFSGQHTFSLSKSAPFNEAAANCQIEPVSCVSPTEYRLRVNNYGSFIDWSPRSPLFDMFQVNIGIGYQKFQKQTSIDFRSGVSVNLPFRQTLQFSYFRNSYNTDFRISLSGPLNFWKSKNKRGEDLNDQALLTESKISGRVYLDENGDREFTPGVDEPMKNIRITLNNGSEVVSDVNGIYSFERVLPGENKIALNIEDVRANLIPANGLEQDLTILPRSLVNIGFRLVKSGSLSGRIWHDINNNGKYDEGEGIRDIRVLASSGRETYTDYDGSYLLTELPPGVQTVFIDERYKPEDLMIENLTSQTEVRSGKETKNVAFIFKTKPREVKEKDFGSKKSVVEDKK